MCETNEVSGPAQVDTVGEKNRTDGYAAKKSDDGKNALTEIFFHGKDFELRLGDQASAEPSHSGTSGSNQQEPQPTGREKGRSRGPLCFCLHKCAPSLLYDTGSGRRAVGLRLRVELRRLGRPRQRGSRRMAAGDDLCNFIEVAGSYQALVRYRAITKFLGCEFFLLQSRVCSHACLRIAARQVEHAHVQRVESRERHELEFVTQLAKLLLEAGDSDVV